MNRAERRAGGWGKLNPRHEYDAFVAEVDEAGVKVMIALLRELAGPNAPFDDRELWNGIRGLINAGLLNIYFRFGADGIEVRPDFLIPPENDNHRRQPTPGGYAA